MALSAKTTVLTAWKEASSRQASLLAAGVAFYAFTSLFPALIAGVLTYGLVADPQTVQRQSQDLADALPADAASLITGQLESLISTNNGSLGIGLIIALLLALQSASGGIGNLITAINIMFGFDETRGFVKRKALAIGLTVAAVVFLLVVVTLVAVTPAVLDAMVDLPGLRVLLEAVRWVILLGALVLGVGVLFRVAPDRPESEPAPRIVSRGVVVAALAWALVSVVFSLYVDNFGSYGKTYGALAGVVILLLWLWIGLFALLIGASIEAVREEALPDEDSPAEVRDDVEAERRGSGTDPSESTTPAEALPAEVERHRASHPDADAREARQSL